MVGNAGRRYAFPAYIFGYLRRFDVWRGLRFTSPRPPRNIKNVGWKSRRRLPPIPKRSIPPETCQNKRCLQTEKRIIFRPTYSSICGELLLGGNAGRRFAFPAYIFGYLRWFDVWRGLRFTSSRIPQEYQKRRVEKPKAPSTNTKTFNPPRSLPKNAKHLGQPIRKSVVICYWLATPEGASLFRPTYLGVCGGLMFGVDCALPA